MSDNAAALPPENLLRRASSPYLLQHAENPVHWRQWGPEALAEARVVVAIGDDPDQLRDWVNDHHPVHLGGASLLAASSAPLLGAGPVVAA